MTKFGQRRPVDLTKKTSFDFVTYNEFDFANTRVSVSKMEDGLMYIQWAGQFERATPDYAAEEIEQILTSVWFNAAASGDIMYTIGL